ncbi:MAG: hypothetical protein P4M09_18405 [Devosia sp.]|nr:hypothetical protein [Devosia sp.]
MQNLHPRHDGRFTVGRDATGHWIVSDLLGRCGGVFTDRATALHYALAESGYNPGDVCAAADGEVLSLDTIFKAPASAARGR